ncbi:MAG: hypothetical protein ACE5FK_05105 [Candidatus Methylomirabilia bacterium]
MTGLGGDHDSLLAPPEGKAKRRVPKGKAMIRAQIVIGLGLAVAFSQHLQASEIRAAEDSGPSALSTVLSRAETQRIGVVTTRVNIPGIDRFFLANSQRVTVPLPSGVTVAFARQIPEPFHHGLKSVAGVVVPHALPPNSTITLALDLQRVRGPYAAFRYTYVEHRLRRGRRSREILVEWLGSIEVESLPPSQVKRNRQRFDQHNLGLGSKWSYQEFEALLGALAQIPESMLSGVDGLRFNRAPGHPADHGGGYNPATHTITMYDRAFEESMTRFGTPGQGLSTSAVRSIVHEIGHAIDLRPLRHAWGRLKQTEAALQSAFGRYERPNGSGTYRVPIIKRAAWKRLRQELTEAERARDQARSASGYRWWPNPQTGSFEVVEGGTGVAGSAFRRAAQQDGGIPITQYSNQEWAEYFAESFSLYITDPQTLQLLRPNVYAFFVANFPR